MTPPASTTLERIDHDSPADREAILRPLLAYNRSAGPDPQYQMLGLLIKSAEGETIGGLWGRSFYQ